MLWSMVRKGISRSSGLSAPATACSGKQQPSADNRGKIHEATRRTAPPAASASELGNSPMMGPPRPARLRASNDEPSNGQPKPKLLNEHAPASATDISSNEERVSSASEPVEEFVGPPRPKSLQTAAPSPRQIQELSDDFVGPPRPGSLPQSGSAQNEDMIPSPQAPPPLMGPPPPPKFNDTADDRVANSADGHGIDRDAAGDDPALPQLPVTNEVILKGHHKIVSAIDVERSGARVVTGGMDYQVCLYDFNGMKSDGRPFRELMPQEGHPVHAVSYSPSGDAFLVVTGEPRAKVCTGAMPLPLHEQNDGMSCGGGVSLLWLRLWSDFWR
jgi:hypothetical protein